jgi:hypothetical protein
MLRRLLPTVILFTAAAIFAAGCGGDGETGTDGAEMGASEHVHEHEHDHDVHAVESPEGFAAESGQTKCPVTGDPININFFADYLGKRIYFSNAAAVEAFILETDNYLKQFNADLEAAKAQAPSDSPAEGAATAGASGESVKEPAVEESSI